MVESLETRVVLYSATGNAWMNPEVITISFVPDGTNLGGVTSNLQSTFNSNPNLVGRWENTILQAAQVSAQQTNINFVVVPDDGEATGSGADQEGNPNFGDIRIGGYNFGNSTLAYTSYPPSVNNYSIAGDIDFNTGMTFNIGSTYDLFTVAAHEFGHALGLGESRPCANVMYPTYTGREDRSWRPMTSPASGASTAPTCRGHRTPTSASTPPSSRRPTWIARSTRPRSPPWSTTSTSPPPARRNSSAWTCRRGRDGSFEVTAQSLGLSLLTPEDHGLRLQHDDGPRLRHRHRLLRLGPHGGPHRRHRGRAALYRGAGRQHDGDGHGGLRTGHELQRRGRAAHGGLAHHRLPQRHPTAFGGRVAATRCNPTTTSWSARRRPSRASARTQAPAPPMASPTSTGSSSMGSRPTTRRSRCTSTGRSSAQR